MRGLEENLPRSGRGRKTGVQGDRIMYRMLRSDRRQSLGEITDQFNCQFVTKISSRTVRRRLNFEGYKKHPVCKKTTISPVDRLSRRFGNTPFGHSTFRPQTISAIVVSTIVYI